MIRIFFMSTLLKAGAHYRLGVRAAFFPVFSGTLLILNPPCQHVFVRSRTDSVRQSLLADGAGNLDIGVPKRRGQETNHGVLGNIRLASGLATIRPEPARSNAKRANGNATRT